MDLVRPHKFKYLDISQIIGDIIMFNSKKYYIKNKKRIRKYQKEYHTKPEIKERLTIYYKKPEIKEKLTARLKKWKKLHPLLLQKQKKRHWARIKDNPDEKIKTKARQKAVSKISIKGVSCFKCKKVQATERHHEDYSKPLEVLLLCKKCHYNLHHPENQGVKKEVL